MNQQNTRLENMLSREQSTFEQGLAAELPG